MTASFGIHQFEVILLLLLVLVVIFAALANRVHTPYPIVLVIAGLCISFIPGIPKITLNPDAVFLGVLPPLLFSAAWLTSWREFSYNLVSICFLAFGLVGFTVFGVAESARWLFSGMDWRTGFVLGAVVATTDSIAATSIAKRIGLPKRIVDLLEGESLINDATGLLALEFGTAILVQGHAPSVGFGLLRLLYLIGAGLGIGLLLGTVVNFLEQRIDDGPIETTISLLVPYAVYLAAEAFHASGVLAVVACGLYLSRKSAEFFSPTVRIRVFAVWESLTFILNGLVFVLIGLQLPYVLAGITDHSKAELMRYGAIFSGLIILLRLVWIFPGSLVANFLRRRLLHQNEGRPPLRRVFVVGWTGMRGVVALAAAISLPQTLANGSAFPQRNLIIYLSFSVILVTLVFQGLTLPPLIRALGLSGVSGTDCEEQEARRILTRAALDYLESARKRDDGKFNDVYDHLAQHYKERLATLTANTGQEDGFSPDHYALYRRLKRDVLRVERHAALSLRNDRRINDELFRQLEREFDLGAAQFQADR
jgi:CPA1 family monovalent cation:H+ antiporter